MSISHTPGPWAVCCDDEFDGCPFIPIETNKPVGPELQLICEVRGSSPDLHITDNDRANARLIAAAPELLSAVIQYRDDLRHPIDEVSRQRRLAMVEAAISKATSRQPEGER